MQFTNLDELLAQIEKDIVDPLDEAGKKMLEIVQENVIEEVYNRPPDYEVRVYNRLGFHGGFLESWQYETMLTEEGNYGVRIFSNPDKMVRSGNHHGNDKKGIDRRDYMDKVIADPEKGDWDYNPGKNQHPWWKEPRDYWSYAMDEINRSKIIDKAFQKGLKRQNINFKKV